MGKQVSEVNYPKFIKPKELVNFIIHTIQYDDNAGGSDYSGECATYIIAQLEELLPANR